ncbi:MAG: diaminobutyrate acetyltransferase [Candidatus Binatia bacterium]
MTVLEAEVVQPPGLRATRTADGAAVWRLVRDAGVLDLNSSYMYLLMCDRFRDTCVVAERDGELTGFVIGVILPDAPDVVFVWQIGVAPAERGRGLGRTLLDRLVHLPACRPIRFMETTVTPSNTASIAMFRSFARGLGAPIEAVSGRGYDETLFPNGKEREVLYRIGPFPKERG